MESLGQEREKRLDETIREKGEQILALQAEVDGLKAEREALGTSGSDHSSQVDTQRLQQGEAAAIQSAQANHEGVPASENDSPSLTYSIDVANRRISGWAVCRDMDSVLAELSFLDSRRFTTRISLDRPDVVRTGFAERSNLRCGFSFYDLEHEIRENSLIVASVKVRDRSYSKSLFVGDERYASQIFDKHQINDRMDFSVMEKPIQALFEEKKNDLVALKELLIRLRRGKRGYGGRGRFKGHSYTECQNDWHFFREIYENHHKTLFRILSPRSIWSFVHTYVDYGDPYERACALSIDNIMYQERFAQSFHLIYSVKQREQVIKDKQLPYWGDMLSNQLEHDDAYDVFLTSNLEALSSHPLMLKTFCHLFLKSLESNKSISGMHKEHSGTFRHAFAYYEKLMKDITSK